MKVVTTLPPAASGGSADPQRVAQIIADVRGRGDAALADWSRQLDRQVPERWSIGADELRAAWQLLPETEQMALDHAARNIERFAVAQRDAMQAFRLEIEPGVWCGQRLLPVARAACYVPGGRYPLPSTVLMTAIPARVAGVGEVVVMTPPRPHPAILAAAYRAGVQVVHPVGGVQAIAAASYGTESIAPVDLIVGPGNAWVTEAKRQVYGEVGIDALAGPSEVLVLFDGSADICKVASDLLAQAEHDPDAQALAATDDAEAAHRLAAEVERQLTLLPTRDVAAASIARHGAIVVVADRDAMVALADTRAPEHLEVHTRDARTLADRCRAFGGIFIGEQAAEVLGDYCAGPSHVLPTGRSGRFTGGLGVHTFVRVLTTQEVEPGAGRSLATTAATLARMEGLEAHARAADRRTVDNRDGER